MNKKIVTIAEIVFALIFVVLLALFMSTISRKGNTANTQLINTLDQTSNTGISSYDSVDMKGEAVISAIKNVKTISDDVKLELSVFTLENSNVGTNYGFIGGGSAITAYEKPKNSAHAQYINPSADFHAELVRNDNNVVIAIHFVQYKTDGTAGDHACKTKKCSTYNTSGNKGVVATPAK